MESKRTECIVCGKKIFRENSIRKEKRRKEGVTCSKECAKIYYKVYCRAKEILIRKTRRSDS
jgi:hypothetical protein